MPGSETLPVTDSGTRKGPSGISRYSWFSLGFLWLIYALNANSRQLMFFVTPALIATYGLTSNQIGSISGAVTFATAVLAIPGMLWADRGGRGWKRKYRHLPVVIGYVLVTFLTGINALTVTLGGFIALQLISHAIAGVGEAVEVTSAAEWWPRRRRGFALGMHHTGFPWGTLIGSSVVGALLTAYGSTNWRLPYLLFPIPVAVVFTGYWFYAKRNRYAALVDHMKAAGEPDAQTEEAATEAAPKGALLHCLGNLNVIMAAILGMFATIAYIGLSFWLTPYLAFIGHYSNGKAASYSTLFTITGGLGMICWGWVSDRLGRKLSLMIVFLWLAVAFVLFKEASGGPAWIIGLQLFAGLAINAPYTLVYSMALDSTKPGTAGVATSIVDVGLAVGGGLGPLLVGWLIGLDGGFTKVAGYNLSVYVIGGLMVVAALVAALFARETTGWFRQRDRALVRARTLAETHV